MPNIKSQKKRVITNNKANERNVAKRSKVRTYVKKYRAAISAGDLALAEKMLPEVVSVIAKAAADGIYKKENASRKVARLSKALTDAKSAPVVEDAPKAKAKKAPAKKSVAAPAEAPATEKAPAKKPAAKKVTKKAE